MKKSFFFVFLLLLMVFASCSGKKQEPAQKIEKWTGEYPYKITTTVGMVTDIVRQIVGDKAVVTGIIGEGIDPHLYKPTRNDVAALMNGDILFYAGLLLEGKLSDALLKVKKTKPVLAVTEQVPAEYLLQPAEFKGHYDPHLWMDISGWMHAVEAALAGLEKFDPDNTEFYRKNAYGYISLLEELHGYAQIAIASIPENKRIMVTAHDAFNYFGRAYNIEVIGIQGISTESEAGIEDLNNLVDLLVEKKIGAIFAETSVADKNIQALIEGAASRGHTMIIGGKLFSDAMGGPGTYEGTYIGMLDHNVTTITRALGGKAPEKGFSGKLK